MNNIRADFPYLEKKRNNSSLIYFDSAATSQKPHSVISAISDFYSYHCSNVHRGIYHLAEETTAAYENVRNKVAQFIGARDHEIIFTRSATESINLVATAWGNEHIKEGDEIVISALEHHSNLLPWQQLCNQKKAKLIVIPVLDNGMLDMQKAAQLITSKTKMVAIVHVSNFIGTHIDVSAISKLARKVGCPVLVDAVQSVAHQSVNVNDLGCDILVFSAHKILGPTGLGILYMKDSFARTVPPYQYGGFMVYEADYHHATWQKPPRKFEAGTPPIAQVIGLGAALDYLKKIDFNALRQHEAALCARLIDGLSKMGNVRILGPIEQLKEKGHLVSFVVHNMHAHDVAAYLDQFNICVRAGHQCAQPLARRFELDAAVRVSFYAYNTLEEVDFFLEKMNQLLKK